MRETITSLLELVGMALVALGLGMRWGLWLALVVGGALLVLIGWLAGGQPRTRATIE